MNNTISTRHREILRQTFWSMYVMGKMMSFKKPINIETHTLTKFQLKIEPLCISLNGKWERVDIHNMYFMAACTMRIHFFWKCTNVNKNALFFITTHLRKLNKAHYGYGTNKKSNLERVIRDSLISTYVWLGVFFALSFLLNHLE